MLYRCTKCNHANESATRCGNCKGRKLVRTERNRIIEEQDDFEGMKIYRSNGDNWTLVDGVFVIFDHDGDD